MKRYQSTNPNLDSVNLNKDCFGEWFCRVWHKNWLERIGKGRQEYGEGFGRTKFQAYRNAMNDLF